MQLFTSWLVILSFIGFSLALPAVFASSMLHWDVIDTIAYCSLYKITPPSITVCENINMWLSDWLNSFGTRQCIMCCQTPSRRIREGLGTKLVNQVIPVSLLSLVSSVGPMSWVSLVNFASPLAPHIVVYLAHRSCLEGLVPLCLVSFCLLI